MSVKQRMASRASAGTLQAAALLLLASACKGDRWVIAGEWVSDDSDAGRRQRDAGPSQELCPTGASLDAERLLASPAPVVDARHAGLWRGTLTGGALAGFPDANVELRVANDGQNSLRFGAAQAAPTELDPSQGYLCMQDAAGARCATASGFVGGFEYPLEAVMSRGDVLSFRIVLSDPWGAWCRLQTPQTWSDPARPCGFGYGAGPRGSDALGAAGCARVTDDGTTTPMDCAVMYSLQHCLCAIDACVARFGDAMVVGLQLTEGQLVGSLWYEGDLDRATVRLARP